MSQGQGKQFKLAIIASMIGSLVLVFVLLILGITALANDQPELGWTLVAATIILAILLSLKATAGIDEAFVRTGSKYPAEQAGPLPTMSWCTRCSAKSGENARFCSECGSSLQIKKTEPAIQEHPSISNVGAAPQSQTLPLGLTAVLFMWSIFLPDNSPLAVPLSFGIIIAAVWLSFSRHRVDQLIAWVVIVIWVISFLNGLFGT